MKTITNHVPRDVIDAVELTETERAQFDYLDWAKIDAGMDSASFVRYKGQLADLGEFTKTSSEDGWDGVRADSAFSGLVARVVENGERVVIGLVLS